jgi:hypothetical protein
MRLVHIASSADLDRHGMGYSWLRRTGRRNAGYSKPLLSDDFGASSRPVVAYMPGALFSGPVARGFETSAMPLRSPVLHP